VTGEWSDTGPLHTARVDHTATLLTDGRVLVVGGSQPDTVTAASTAEIWDPKSGRFTPTGSMRTGRTWHTATRLQDGTVLIVGGIVSIDANDKMNQKLPAERWSPKTGKFTVTGPNRLPRELPAVTLLRDGRVLIIGGITGSDNPDVEAEAFDPTTAQYSRVSVTGFGDTVTLLQDGRVLECGEFIPDNRYFAAKASRAYLYDPATDTETQTASLNTPRTFPTATLLPNGQVLIAGGGRWVNESISPLDSAELYVPGSPATPAPAGT